MNAIAVDREPGPESWIGRILCHDVRGASGSIIFRKGHIITAEDAESLERAEWNELHLLELSPDDVGQREAGQRLAEMLASPAVDVTPAGHRHVLKSKGKGLLRIDVDALRRMNGIEGIAVFTLHDDEVVAPGRVVAEAQITPLAIDRRHLESVGAIAAASEGVVRILPFAPRRVVIWTRGERALAPLAGKLEWLGCTVAAVVDLPDDAASIRRAWEERHESDDSLYIVVGSNALDPLDAVFVALERLGATMQRVAVPVHPGTLLWIAQWKSMTVVGLPSCGFGQQLTAVDLVLPRLLALGSMSDDELAALGHGGILGAPPRRPIPQEETPR